MNTIAKGHHFMLYVPGFSAFNELGKFHYNATIVALQIN